MPKKPQNAKPSRNVELVLQVKMISTQPTPRQGTLFHPTNIVTRLVTTGLVIGRTHARTLTHSPHRISKGLLHCTYSVNFSHLWLNSATMINSSKSWTMTIFMELTFSMDTTFSLCPNISMEVLTHICDENCCKCSNNQLRYTVDDQYRDHLGMGRFNILWHHTKYSTAKRDTGILKSVLAAVCHNDNRCNARGQILYISTRPLSKSPYEHTSQRE
jgi:hypothetical protein